MAPKKKPYNQLRKSAKNYRDNAAARRHKNAENRQINKREDRKTYRAEHNKVRRQAGAYGKGGKDFSQTTKGTFVREDPSKNRARNRGKLTIR
jgi:lipoprotein-anchoring transpeptidase ErfK/SrfK